MMWRFAAALLLCSRAAWSEDWQPMQGSDIAQALTGRVLDYPSAWQDFRASGRTLHHAGRDSWGYWAVRGDRYCSMWPPSDLWACYDMTRAGDRLRFIDGQGNISEGKMRAATD